MPPGRRVTVVAHELRGFAPVGGMGTATTFLALALARLGHDVEILLGKHAPDSIDAHWEAVYRDAGIPIRPVPQSDEVVTPWQFVHAHNVAEGLRRNPSDVVIAHDFGAPAYSALRLREAGLGFEDTLFVIFCHGPRRYVVDLSPTLALGDLHAVLGVGVLEQAAVELADAVVSPSAYLLEWMRARAWRLPQETRVIPYFSAGEPAEPAPRPDPNPLRRLTFFGRVDEKKGLKLFASALNAQGAERLRGVEVEFVGKTTRTWTRQRAEALLTEQTRHALRGVTFATDLDRAQALARLSRPGTLVVMPSLQENSPNTVYECLEHEISFIASNVGGVQELIAPEDQSRTLFEPTTAALADTLGRLLDDVNVPPPVRPAFAASESYDSWAEVLDLEPLRRPPSEDDPAEFVLLADEAHVLPPDLLPKLQGAQRATGADVVTCGVRVDGTVHLFAGDAGGLGALENTYGTVALVRRELLGDAPDQAPPPRDRAWPLLARLAASGARIVSLPLPLAESATPPGTVADDPVGALLAVQELERALPEAAKGAARLAAGLASR
jgi:glycosyltransferase involved in cell wall biosynthesis